MLELEIVYPMPLKHCHSAGRRVNFSGVRLLITEDLHAGDVVVATLDGLASADPARRKVLGTCERH